MSQTENDNGTMKGMISTVTDGVLMFLKAYGEVNEEILSKTT